MTIASTQTVGEIAAQLPNCTREFERLGIDYCCGGNRTLDQACVEAKLPINDVLERLKQSAESADATGSTENWRQASLAELIANINATHHVFVRSECPRIQALTDKVVGVHGKNPELLQVQEIFNALSEELTVHLMKEEQILFPYILRMEESAVAGEPAPPSMFGTVMNPIGMMMREHDGAGEALRALRLATHDYTLPAEACISYRTLYQALQGFEADLHQHIHKENNILFPRVAAMETNR